MRDLRWQLLIAIGGLILVVGLLVGQTPNLETTSPQPVVGGVYTEALVGDIQRLNPILDTFSQTDRDIDRLIYGSLVQFDRGDLKKLKTFVQDHSEDFSEFSRLLSELEQAEKTYRNSLIDLTHNHVRLLYSRSLWKQVLDSTVTGWRVRNLVAADADAGIWDVHWNGRDDEGRGVASGVYFVKLAAGAEQRRLKITLVR